MRPDLAMLLITACVGGIALAQEKKSEAPAPTAPTPAPAADPIPDLDEMLGLPSQRRAAPAPDGAAPAPPGPDALDSDQLELERKLTAKELAEKFDEAVRQMGESADRLERIGDVGIATQRLHEEILRKLDVLIKQSSQGSPSSSGSQQQQQQDSESARAAQQRQQRGNNPNQQPGGGDNRSERLPPAMTAAERQSRLDTARAAWGSLPERVRDSLLEGSSDYFSSLYEAMTEAYYKRIAEEAKE